MNGLKIQLLGIAVILAGIATSSNNGLSWVGAGIGLIAVVIGLFKNSKDK